MSCHKELGRLHHQHGIVKRNEIYINPYNKKEKATIGYYTYEQDPTKPWFFFTYLAHGDESENYYSLMKTMTQNLKSLGNFVFIPVASPSAFWKDQHQNSFNNDLNRSFDSKYHDPEVEAIKKIINKHMDKHGAFKAGFMFHQDTDRKGDDWYLYRYGQQNQELQFDLENLRKQTQEIGIRPYTGIDDENDDQLHYLVKNGFVDADNRDDGSLEKYLLELGTPIAYVFESPMNLGQEKHDLLIELFFQNVVLPTINN